MLPNNIESTTERHELDPIFKDAVTFSFGELGIPIQTQVEISRLPRTMDVLVCLNQPDQIKLVRTETAFSYFRLRNQIEYKGENDPLTLWEYRLILGRANLYLGENRVSASDMTVTIVSARQPRKILFQCPDDVRWEKVGDGHYKSMEPLSVHLFVCNELVVEPKNYSLLLFASSKEKFRRFLHRLIDEENSVYINYASLAQPELTREVLQMAGKRSYYERRFERVAKTFGTDLAPHISKDELLKQLTLEDRARNLTPEERERLKQLLEEEYETVQ